MNGSPGEGRGGGGYLTKCDTGEAPPRGPSPSVPFCIPFWQKRYPFYISFRTANKNAARAILRISVKDIETYNN